MFIAPAGDFSCPPLERNRETFHSLYLVLHRYLISFSLPWVAPKAEGGRAACSAPKAVEPGP